MTAVLRLFDNIECEWPLFYSYLAIINIFAGNMVQAEEFCHLLEDLTVAKDGAMLVPELYLVPEESISAESQAPGSSERVYDIVRHEAFSAQSINCVATVEYWKRITQASLVHER